jgi:hypothetical protein
MGKYMLIPALLFLTVLAFSLADAAVIKTVPERTVWIADGTTEYTVYVYLDNSGLEGVGTMSAEWGLVDTQGFQYIEGSSSAPGVNDFFAGITTFYEIFSYPTSLSGRAVSHSVAPVDHQGYLGEYKFVVPVGTQEGKYQFDLREDTAIYDDQSAQPQQYNVKNVPVIVCPPASSAPSYPSLPFADFTKGFRKNSRVMSVCDRAYTETEDVKFYSKERK